MKWGVKGASSAKTSAPPASVDHVTVAGHQARAKAGGLKALSNQDLQQVVTRLNLEQQHRALTSNKPSRFDKGHSHIKKVLKVAKTMQEIHSLVNSPASKALKTAVKVAK